LAWSRVRFLWIGGLVGVGAGWLLPLVLCVPLMARDFTLGMEAGGAEAAPDPTEFAPCERALKVNTMLLDAVLAWHFAPLAALPWATRNIAKERFLSVELLLLPAWFLLGIAGGILWQRGGSALVDARSRRRARPALAKGGIHP
jgi:hypothetical protein